MIDNRQSKITNPMFPTQILEALASRIAGLQPGHPLRIGIDGIDASGKTTLADALAPQIERLGRPAIRASLDGFHNLRQVRRRRGGDSPEGYYLDSFNYPLLIECLLTPLGPGGSRVYRSAAFDYRTDTALETPRLEAAHEAVLLFDGVFLQRPELRSFWDFVIFIDIPFETALRRAETRDAVLFGSPEAVRQRYLRRYIPGQKLYLTQCQPRAGADVIITEQGTVYADPPAKAVRR